MQRLLAIFILLLTSLSVTAAEVVQSTNLQADGARARQLNVPLMLIFHAEHCHFCKLQDEEVLKPMVLSGDYTDKVLLRKVVVDSYGSVTDFAGRRVDAVQLAEQYKVNMTPTILFLDPRGRELIKRIRGITGAIDYFGSELDLAIAKAGKMLKQQEPTLSPMP